jgi:dUTP pyrophosphatase
MLPVLKIKKLHPDANLPTRAHPGDSGLDLHACVDAPFKLFAGEQKLISTGIAVQFPEGQEGQVRPRSGMACKNGITVLNSPGTLDNAYTGEIKVLLINHGPHAVDIKHGDRIAQLVIAPVTLVSVLEVQELNSTERAAQGFGSSGV